MQAKHTLRENIKALLLGRKEDASTLASWLGHDKSWINKILNGHRDMQIEDFDKVADFFGVATYQLFQPGISALTERRVRYDDRRSSRDRRISHEQRIMRGVASRIDRVKDNPHEAARTTRTTAALRAIVTDFEARVSRLLAEQDYPGGQAPKTRAAVPKARRRRRVAGGHDASEPEDR